MAASRRPRARGTAALLAAVIAAAMPAAAAAGDRFDYVQKFTTPVPGASANTDTQILYKHPDDPDAKPIPVRREVFTFPKGTGFDHAVVPPCKASDLELMIQGEAACPPESRVGGGEGTSMSGFPGAGESAMEVDGFEDGSGLLLLGGSKEPPIRFVAHARQEGRVVTVEVPRTPGGPPDGESAIRRVHNVFEPRTLGRRAYMRTPPKCPKSGHWTFRAQLTFADGAVDDDVYRMRCRRHARRAARR